MKSGWPSKSRVRFWIIRVVLWVIGQFCFRLFSCSSKKAKTAEYPQVSSFEGPRFELTLHPNFPKVGLFGYNPSIWYNLYPTQMKNSTVGFFCRDPISAGLEQSFYSFYVCTAVRKFFFFLDPLRSGRIKIQGLSFFNLWCNSDSKFSDILACSFLDDLLELRDEELPKSALEQNWFSAPSALRVYGLYLNLDRDHNGMLSMEELSKLGCHCKIQIFYLSYSWTHNFRTSVSEISNLPFRLYLGTFWDPFWYKVQFWDIFPADTLLKVWYGDPDTCFSCPCFSRMPNIWGRNGL